MHVVVDGSNLATEGRSLPSLKQLIEGVLEFRTENPDAQVVVVVDATFGHRIDEAERPLFEEGIVHQEIVSPPAGAIGRGDAFVLRIAEKVGATVLSNDSFQEFHAEHEWLFEPGRLIGGKPVPGVGWIFTPRTPVRGPRSREATQEAKRKQRKAEATADLPLVSGAELVEKGKAALDKLPKGRREKQKKDDGKGREEKKDEHKGREAKKDEHKRTAKGEAADDGVSREPRRGRRSRGSVEDAIAVATVEAVLPDADEPSAGEGKRRKRRRKAPPLAEPVNEPGVFLELVAACRPGDVVEGQVEEFSSHGAFVTVQGARCYIPLTLMGDPAPRAARDVLKRGEVREFVVRAFDAARRGVELALPGIALPVGPVTDETALAAVGEEAPDDVVEEEAAVEAPTPARRAKQARPAKAAKAAKAAKEAKEAAEPPAAAAGAELAPSRPRRARKAATVDAEAPAVTGTEEVAPVAAPTARPRRAKKAVADAAQPAAEVVAPAPGRRTKKAAAAPEAEAVPAAQQAAEPAARRRAKKAAAPAEPAVAEPPADGHAPAAAAEAPAPPRPRRARKAVAPPQETPAEPPAVEPPPPPPASRGRRRKAAPPPEAALLPAAESVPPPVPAPAEPGPTPAPAPRKRAKKAAATVESPTPAAPAPAADGPAAEPPAPRSRASRKARPPVAQPAATLATADPPAGPARSRTRKAMSAGDEPVAPPAAEAAPAPAVEPAPAKASSKRRAAKKPPPG